MAFSVIPELQIPTKNKIKAAANKIEGASGGRNHNRMRVIRLPTVPGAIGNNPVNAVVDKNFAINVFMNVSESAEWIYKKIQLRPSNSFRAKNPPFSFFETMC